MKTVIILAAMFVTCTSCNSQQTEAKEKAAEIKSTIEKTKPGTLPAAEGSWTMTATINGKQWKASSFMPPESVGKIIGNYNDDYLALPYSKKSMKVGRKFKLGESDGGYSTEYFTPLGNDIALMTKGEMVVTKASDGWAEGTFYFTSTYPGARTVNVTNGFFRIKTPN